MQVAIETGAEAIHPGYGFLSENPNFAAECEKNKIKFIGPTPENIRLMGDKMAAKDSAKKAGRLLELTGEGALLQIHQGANQGGEARGG